MLPAPAAEGNDGENCLQIAIICGNHSPLPNTTREITTVVDTSTVSTTIATTLPAAAAVNNVTSENGNNTLQLPALENNKSENATGCKNISGQAVSAVFAKLREQLQQLEENVSSNCQNIGSSAAAFSVNLQGI